MTGGTRTIAIIVSTEWTVGVTLEAKNIQIRALTAPVCISLSYCFYCFPKRHVDVMGLMKLAGTCTHRLRHGSAAFGANGSRTLYPGELHLNIGMGFCLLHPVCHLHGATGLDSVGRKSSRFGARNSPLPVSRALFFLAWFRQRVATSILLLYLKSPFPLVGYVWVFIREPSFISR